MRDTRIQKALADQGLCSRRQAEQIIQEGRVKLNGRPVNIGDKMDIKADVITVDDNRIVFDRKKEFYYYMLNKPRGYITTSKDDRGRKTVLELVKDIPARVYPVGRLDKDSEGLLLFTNDGEFANLLTHPSHQISKLYRVTVKPTVTEEQLIALANGVYLDDGTKTLPAMIKVVTQEENRSVMEMSIKEGKNRQIRRMCAAVGLEVARLRRNAVGAVKLGMLAPGKYRELKPSEVIALKSAASKLATSEAPTKKPAQPRATGAKPAYSKSTDAKPAYSKSTDAKPAYSKSTDAKPAYSKSTDAKPAYSKSTGAKPAYSKSTGAKPAYSKSTGAKPAYSKATGAKPAYSKATGAKTVNPKPFKRKEG